MQGVKSLQVPVTYNPPLFHGCNLFIGPSDSGKTYALQTIIRKIHSSIKTFYVISRVQNTRLKWRAFFKSISRPVAILPDLADGFLEWLEEKQRISNTTSMLILDDVLGSISSDKQVNIKNNKAFDWLAMNGRHLKLNTCVLIQTPVGVTPSQSASAVTTFVFNFGSSQIRTIHIFPKFISQCDGQFPILYSLSNQNRYRAYHKLFNTLQRWECIYITKDQSLGQPRMKRFKA